MRKFLLLILIGGLALGIAVYRAIEIASAANNIEETTDVPSDGLTDNKDDKYVSAYPGFKVSSESLHDGKWDEICSNASGENASPQLSWEPVEGAATYVIYMVDMNTNNFIHWKSAGITETTLPQGWASAVEYFGPNPQTGITHQYNIYVFALKAPVERAKGGLGQAPKLQKFMDELDTDAEGNSGNIIAVGRIIGNYTAK